MVTSHVGRSPVYRAIVFAAVLFTTHLAMAEEKRLVQGPVAAFPNSLCVPCLKDSAKAEAQSSAWLSSDMNRFPFAADTAGGSAPQGTPSQADRLQDQLERQARRFQAGVRGGVALDPELILVGGQAQFGPIFSSRLFFRPSVEFAYGEITAMFGFNGEFIYRLSQTSAQDRWSTYFGGGLAVNLLQQNFERDDEGSRIDFDEFNSDTALNILGGVQNRNGIFLELRTSIYSSPSPTLRLMVGYSF